MSTESKTSKRENLIQVADHLTKICQAELKKSPVLQISSYKVKYWCVEVRLDQETRRQEEAAMKDAQDRRLKKIVLHSNKMSFRRKSDDFETDRLFDLLTDEYIAGHTADDFDISGKAENKTRKESPKEVSQVN
jgi:hypothetical protein